MVEYMHSKIFLACCAEICGGFPLRAINVFFSVVRLGLDNMIMITVGLQSGMMDARRCGSVNLNSTQPCIVYGCRRVVAIAESS